MLKVRNRELRTLMFAARMCAGQAKMQMGAARTIPLWSMRSTKSGIAKSMLLKASIRPLKTYLMT